MRLTILGVTSPYPRDGRATLGYTVEEGDYCLLLEAGCGVHRRLAEEGLLERVEAVVLSHLHYDHCADLPAVVLAVTLGRGRDEPLPVFLPPGESERLRQWFAASGFGFALNYATPIELDFERPAVFGALTIAMRPAAHSLPAGIVIITVGGKRLVYTGDTGDCPALDDAITAADFVLAEVTHLPPDEAAAKGHLPAALLGGLARRAGVKRLVVTHFMHGSDPEVLARDVSLTFGRGVTAARIGDRYEI